MTSVRPRRPPFLLAEAPGKIRQFSGDAIYDERRCYEAINEHRAAIPPRKGARIWRHSNSKAERQVRDENLRRIRQEGRGEWKRESHYHRRSLAETTVFRYETVFDERLRTRKVEKRVG